jgi:predicted kinase
MPKLLILKGLQGSGKSTYARELVQSSHGAWGRVNRDDMRETIFCSQWSRNKEEVIIEGEKALARAILASARNVVVDDLNLAPKTQALWKNFAQENGAEYTEKFFDTPLETCIARDDLRLSPIGANVIRKTAARYGLIDWGDKPIVISDLDGTLCDGSHRNGVVNGEKKDWDTYFSLLGEDKPVYAVFKWLHALQDTHTIVLMSGRPAKYLKPTMDWFRKVWQPRPLFPEIELPMFRIDHAFFRDDHDKRPDVQVKTEMLNLLPRSQVAFAIDDRISVVEQTWRANGIKVFPVRCEDRDFY